jgi:hypothetical protein
MQMTGALVKIKTAFKMPRPVKITGRSSTITNSFVNGIIPVIPPSDADIVEALRILGMTAKDVQCSYCGDKATEWDHLRPIVKNKRPTGYISEIANLVPACGKCNQSKSGTPWREWIEGTALQCPRVRGISDLLRRIERLEAYEAWREPTVVDWEAIIEPELWKAHWDNLERIHEFMRECQKVSDRIKAVAKSAAVTQPVLAADRQNAVHFSVG